MLRYPKTYLYSQSLLDIYSWIRLITNHMFSILFLICRFSFPEGCLLPRPVYLKTVGRHFDLHFVPHGWTVSIRHWPPFYQSLLLPLALLLGIIAASSSARNLHPWWNGYLREPKWFFVEEEKKSINSSLLLKNRNSHDGFVDSKMFKYFTRK